MGCCESRDKTADKKSSSHKSKEEVNEIVKSAPAAHAVDAPNGIIAEGRKLGFRDLNEEDPEAYERYLYIEELENTRTWESVKDSSWFKIQKIKGTKYDDYFPVSKIWFSLDERVDLSIILEYLNNPEKRLSWDKNFKIYEVIDGTFQTNYVIYYLASLLAYKGDYIEKRVCATHNDTVVIVYYSVENEKRPAQKGVSRGKTFIGLTRIRLVNDKIEFELFAQSDPDSSLAKLAANLGVSKSDEWCKKYKTALLANKKSKENRETEVEIIEDNKV